MLKGIGMLAETEVNKNDCGPFGKYISSELQTVKYYHQLVVKNENQKKNFNVQEHIYFLKKVWILPLLRQWWIVILEPDFAKLLMLLSVSLMSLMCLLCYYLSYSLCAKLLMFLQNFQSASFSPSVQPPSLIQSFQISPEIVL